MPLRACGHLPIMRRVYAIGFGLPSELREEGGLGCRPRFGAKTVGRRADGQRLADAFASNAETAGEEGKREGMAPGGMHGKVMHETKVLTGSRFSCSLMS